MFCSVWKQSEIKWSASLIVDFAKSRWSPVREFFGISRNKTLLVDSGRSSVVLAQAFESLRFPFEQGESFSDLSCLTCARQPFRLATSISNLTSPCNGQTWKLKGTDTIMTSPEREPPKTSTKRSPALWSPTGITPLDVYPVFIAIKGGGRPTHVYLTPKCCLFPQVFSSAG